MFYVPLIISIIYFLLSYIMCRSSPKSMYNKDLPNKYLIKSNLLKKYFLNPRDELTKHFVYSHFISIFILVFNFVIYFLYFYNGSTSNILTNANYLPLLGILIVSVDFIVFAIDAIIYTKIDKDKKW